MPKKGGKRLADIDGQEGEKAEGGDDNAAPEGAEAAAAQQEEATAESTAEVQQGQIEPKKVSESSKVQGDTTPAVEPGSEQAGAIGVKATPKTVIAPQSQRQKQAASAWEHENKSVEKFYVNVFSGVEKDIQSVNSSLQANATSAQDTLRNVSVASKLLWQISESLRSVDTLVVPIVLQRDGNF